MYATPANRQSGPQAFLKAALDRTFAAAGIFVMFLPMLVIATCIKIAMGSPVFFRDSRVGRYDKQFTLWKFRSMRNQLDSSGRLLNDHQRITSIGRLLRSASFDELPQLWNVLRGDMSLVGPRPLPPLYLPLYSEEQARRHHVMPGITGWVQVNGRNALNWERKFELDVWYVDHWSILLDLRILLKTVNCVFLRRGISHSEHVTMPFFLGHENHASTGSSPQVPSNSIHSNTDSN